MASGAFKHLSDGSRGRNGNVDLISPQALVSQRNEPQDSAKEDDPDQDRRVAKWTRCPLGYMHRTR